MYASASHFIYCHKMASLEAPGGELAETEILRRFHRVRVILHAPINGVELLMDGSRPPVECVIRNRDDD